MYILLITIHIVVCLILISTILLQAGRGGGLTEAFGGGGSDTIQSVLGTQAPVILKKATTISAIAFLVTSLVLGMVTARRGMSLFERVRFPASAVTPQKVVVPAAVPGELPGKEAEPAAEPAPAEKEAEQAVEPASEPVMEPALPEKKTEPEPAAEPAPWSEQSQPATESQ
ncbi:MAG: preprotein translocase subunit SecG [Candidatus Makaraimicrobium thalassicum]|nr:MAG: preprotein translocase subunit SecG [Candidatus Omnitrophota bacterium]